MAFHGQFLLHFVPVQQQQQQQWLWNALTQTHTHRNTTKLLLFLFSFVIQSPTKGQHSTSYLLHGNPLGIATSKPNNTTLTHTHTHTLNPARPQRANGRTQGEIYRLWNYL